MAEIVLEGVGKRYPDGTHAVRPTNLTIRDGELFILVGPSGCGKSTLLKLIVGLERPSSGRILVGGEDVTGRDPKDRNMAMVFQSYAIYPHMTVRENMAFPLRLARLDKAEIRRRVEEAARILELGELLERKPAALSGGQRQRVAMGRAIVRQPAAFLLDEPLSNLDAKLRTQMRAELSGLQRRLGTTTVYVTHDQTEAMTLGHRIALLRRGEIQQIGTPRDLYERPANLFVAGFIGMPAMNLLPARIDGDKLELPMATVPLPERYRGLAGGGARGVIAGLRPEHFADAGLLEVHGDDPYCFPAPVKLLEWLGASLFVHFDIRIGDPYGLVALRRELDVDAADRNSLRLVAALETASAAAEGETIKLRLNPDGLMLFDAAGGERILARQEKSPQMKRQ